MIDAHGRRRDMHLKGSGRTPFARGGDGKAVVGPDAARVRDRRGDARARHSHDAARSRVVATGEQVSRERLLPGAVLARVAASHIRVGTFQYVAARGDAGAAAAPGRLRDRPPLSRRAGRTYLDFFERVVDAQAALIARWMHVGFIHGVMNTDNMAISGETIDYGPCAFMDAYDPATVFSSIDHAGRYAYGNQPAIAQWNLARFAETLLPLIDADTTRRSAKATEVLETFPDRYRAGLARRACAAKLGLAADDDALIADLLALLRRRSTTRRSSARSPPRCAATATRSRALFADPPATTRWRARWLGRADPTPDAMDRVNPLYIPRNHLVEDALTAATAGDLDPLHRLVDVLHDPFDERPGLEAYAEPAPQSFGLYQTFCGT